MKEGKGNFSFCLLEGGESLGKDRFLRVSDWSHSEV